VPLDQRQQGLELARTLETAASRPQIAGSTLDDVSPAANAPRIQPVDLPPSQVGAPPVPADRQLQTVRPVTPRPVGAAKPRTEPIASPQPKPVAVPSGNWKVQLAAFGNAGKADALWASLHGRIAALGPYRAFVTTSGPITRLQAGPLPSRAAADTLCAAVKASGQACLPVAP